MGAGRVERILVVEDNDHQARALVSALLPFSADVVRANSVEQARAALVVTPPDLLIVDLTLPDGTAFEVLTTARGMPRLPPAIAISGTAGPADSFLLAQLGVRAFLAKPFTLTALAEAMRTALTRAPDLDPLLRVTVGRRPVREVEDEVRRVMVREAVARAGGSRRGAARLLSISRQLLQHIVRALDDGS
jgi:two-component system, response regulator RegA